MAADEYNPYAPPVHGRAEPMAPGDAGEAGNFRSNAGRTKWLSIFLVGGLILDFVAMASTYGQIRLLDRVAGGGQIDEAEAASNDLREGAIGLLQTVLILATAVTFCMWVYRAYGNLRPLGATGLKTTPGWAVGSFFIPILNLFRPYQAMSEIYRASDPSVGKNTRDLRESLPGWATIGWWWALWLFSGILGQAIFRTTLSAETVEQNIAVSWLSILDGALSIPLTLLVLAVVRRINARQEEKASRTMGLASLE